ncbi:uncharacterized protein DFL_005579 [Arthrobotrys flagrans]|uniref:F-box domain-containing protein n=1 Tax=Arthrobotrys flagrans TaxID=97331 RepID=A0A436ZYI1_ARTFL|nr:hypothetical protein DFL_005579 [Arthrobotrys flagrans]
MDLPPELLIQILEPYRNKSQKLAKLRLVNHHFNNVIISYFRFPEKIRVVYGFEEAVLQMKSLGKNDGVMMGNVRAVFLPSESFWPVSMVGEEGRFSEKYTFPWTLQRHHDSIQNITQSTTRQYFPTILHENPQNPSFDYHPNLHNRESNEGEGAIEYLNLLSDLLYACKNLEVLEIAMGVGWDTGRMQCWAGMFMNKLFEVVSKIGVKKVRIMIPYVYNLGMFFRGCGEDGCGVELKLEFPKLQSVAVMSNSTGIRGYGYDETTLKEEFAKTLKYFFQDESIRVLDTRDVHDKAIWNTFRMEKLDWGSRYFLGERILGVNVGGVVDYRDWEEEEREGSGDDEGSGAEDDPITFYW